MPDILSELRAGCTQVAARARFVRINEPEIPGFAAKLKPDPSSGPDPDSHLMTGTREERAAFWLTLDAINFGSGWFPTLRKRDGRSGYLTIAGGLRDRFAQQGAWPAHELRRITAAELAEALGQDPSHELIALFVDSLRDLGRHVEAEHGGSFAAVADCAGGSSLRLVETLAAWAAFADTSSYQDLKLPFLKRAQIVTADLHRAGVLELADLDRLTMFADNLVPHVLRLDGVLDFDQGLVRRIERGELIDHGSTEEVEIRACALQAVELIAKARPGSCPAELDQQLWLRGQGERYKAVPRHRARCTAY